MKQTATDWMFDQLWETPKDKLAWFKILMDAKQMEKEQIIEAHINGQTEWDNTPQQDINIKFSEHYYKHTYK